MGTLDFFLLEASEYLERLDSVAQAPAGQGAPSDELVRLSRAFRGSALMASQHGIARAAQGLEVVCRALRDGRLPWDDRIRGEVIRAVDDCKTLLRGLRQPDPTDVEKAEALGSHLERLAGRPSAAARAASAGLDAGARAYVAREAAAIASALQRTAQSLAADPSHTAPVNSLLPAMSALRGVAVLSDLPPLAEILGAVEGAVKEVAGLSGPVGAAGAAAFEHGARALARAAREVVDAGKPVAESDEARQFAASLLAAFTAPPDVVSVESLFYSDSGPHIVSRGSPPQGTGGTAKLDMVSLGEFLRAAATELRRTTSPILRDLRLFAVAASLRPTAGAAGSPLADAMGSLAVATRDAVGHAGASSDQRGFLAALEEAADALCGAQTSDEGGLTARLARAAQAMSELAALPAARAPEPEAAAPAPVPIEAPAPAAVAAAAPPPVAAAAPSPVPAAAPPPVPAAAPPPAAPGDDLALGYDTFERLVAERSMQLASLDDLIAAPAAAPLHRPIAPTREVPVVPVEALAPEERVVPIESLLYRGDRALARILELRPEVLAAAHGANGADLKALLLEVFDLVELGRSAER
jgi:hypothetical protein